jgi:U3 small nucleolar RNA-associated protein 3
MGFARRGRCHLTEPPHPPCRLVQLRAYLERVRPIDKQLGYQIDKLLKATAVAREGEEGEGGWRRRG